MANMEVVEAARRLQITLSLPRHTAGKPARMVMWMLTWFLNILWLSREGGAQITPKQTTEITYLVNAMHMLYVIKFGKQRQL